ncbi:MAG: hypothetical protein ACFBSG_17020 [Leptolyngbyaceae cyanobacterium]
MSRASAIAIINWRYYLPYDYNNLAASETQTIITDLLNGDNDIRPTSYCKSTFHQQAQRVWGPLGFCSVQRFSKPSSGERL